jgi:hypothetical protein
VIKCMKCLSQALIPANWSKLRRGALPKQCPACHSNLWNTPRARKLAATAYG